MREKLTDEQIEQVRAWKETEPHVQNKQIAKRFGVNVRLVDYACNHSPELEAWRAFEPTKKRRARGTAPKSPTPERQRYFRALTDDEVGLVLQWRAAGVPKNEQARRLHRTGRKFDDLCADDPRLSPVDEPPPLPVRHGAGKRRKRLTAHQVTWVQKWAADGHSITAIANKLHIGRERLAQLIKTDDEIKAAYEVGRDQEEQGYVNLLKQQAERGNPVPSMFILKGKFGWRDQGPTTTVSIDNSDRRQVALQLPPALSFDDYLKVVEQLAANFPVRTDRPPLESMPSERTPAVPSTPVLINARRNRNE